MSVKNGGRLLVGGKAIMTYLAVGRKTFERFIEMGMPANFIDGRWYADESNLDDFTRALTKTQPRKMIEESEIVE